MNNEDLIKSIGGPAAWASYNTLTDKTRFSFIPVQSLQPGVYQHTKLYTEGQLLTLIEIMKAEGQ